MWKLPYTLPDMWKLPYTLPDMWKLTNVTQIFKKGDKQLIKNDKPISLHPICDKIFKNIIFNNLNANHLITKNQSIVNEICKAFEDPKSLEVGAVFLDISKAFDKVWHDGLIFNLKQNGISGGYIKLFENYLHNKKHCVVLNCFSYDYSIIESGVPQGSVLGPLLFLIYINDFERNIRSKVKFLTDDTMLFLL